MVKKVISIRINGKNSKNILEFYYEELFTVVIDLMAAQGAFGTDFYDRSILRPKHRAYYRSGRPVIKISVPNAPWAAMRSAQFTPLQASDRV